jgi:hypothetical protein
VSGTAEQRPGTGTDAGTVEDRSATEPTGRRDAATKALRAALRPTQAERAARRRNGGFALLPFVPESGAAPPATDATWTWSLRRFGRGAIWLLPVFAVVYGVTTQLGGGAAPYYTNGGLAHLIGWTGAIWLGLLAVLALTALLASARSRGMATAGLVVGLAGVLLMLPFAAVPAEATVFDTAVRPIVLTGSAVYSFGWFLTGWAVLHSGVFSRADGVLLMVAAPLLGIGGALLGPLQTLGAFFALASGLGVAWRSSRLVPPTPRAAPLRGAAEGVVGAVVPVRGPATP